MVVQLRLADAERPGQPLDREGLVVLGGHELEDPEPQRVRQGLDGLDVGDASLGEGIGAEVEGCGVHGLTTIQHRPVIHLW